MDRELFRRAAAARLRASPSMGQPLSLASSLTIHSCPSSSSGQPDWNRDDLHVELITDLDEDEYLSLARMRARRKSASPPVRTARRPTQTARLPSTRPNRHARHHPAPVKPIIEPATAAENDAMATNLHVAFSLFSAARSDHLPPFLEPLVDVGLGVGRDGASDVVRKAGPQDGLTSLLDLGRILGHAEVL